MDNTCSASNLEPRKMDRVSLRPNNFPLLLCGLFFLVILTRSLANPPSETSFQIATLEVEAAGRPVELGQLYNLHTGQLTPFNLFTSSVPSSLVRKNEVDRPQLRSGIVHSLLDKIQALDLSSETAVRILSGLLRPIGSAGYLIDPLSISSRQAVEGFLQYSEITVQHTLEVWDSELDSLMNTSPQFFRNSDVTHVVVAIKYGGNSLFRFRHRKPRECTSTPACTVEVEGQLESQFAYIKSGGQIPPNASLDFRIEELTDISRKLENPENGTVLKTYQDVRQLVSRLPAEIWESSPTKGRAQTFTLLPIKFLVSKGNVSKTDLENESEPAELQFKKLIGIFDELFAAKIKLEELQLEMNAVKICIKTADLIKLKTLRDKLDLHLSKLKAAIRSEVDFDLILENFDPGNFSDLQLDVQLNTNFREVKEKMEKFRFFEAMAGVEYMGRDSPTLNSFLMRFPSQMTFVLFYSPDLERAGEAEWAEDLEVFRTLLSQPFHKRILVDCDFGEALCTGLKTTVIQQYVGNRLVSPDFLAELHRIQNRPDLPLLSLPALGRSQKVGDLYDASTGKFIDGISLFKSQSLTKYSVNINQDRLHILAQSIPAIFKELKISPNIQLQILAGKLALSPVFVHLLENSGSSSVISLKILLAMASHREFIRDNFKDLSTAISIPALLTGSATHLVQAVEFGGNSVLTFSADSGRGEAEQAKKVLRRELNALKRHFHQQKSDSNSSFVSKLAQFPTDYSVKITSDLTGVDPQKMDLAEFFGFYSSVLKNKTRGDEQNSSSPVSFVLQPLESLEKYFGVIPDIPKFGSISPNSNFTGIVNIYEAIQRAGQFMGDLETELVDYEICFPDSALDSFYTVKEDLEDLFTKFKADIAETFQKIQRGTADESELIRVKSEFLSNGPFGANLELSVRARFAEYWSKVDLFKRVEALEGIQYIGRDQENLVEEELFRASENPVYLLYFKNISSLVGTPRWISLTHLFFVSLDYKKDQLFLVDCDFELQLPVCADPEYQLPVIHEFVAGELTNADFNSSVVTERTQIEKIKDLVLDFQNDFSRLSRELQDNLTLQLSEIQEKTEGQLKSIETSTDLKIQNSGQQQETREAELRDKISQFKAEVRLQFQSATESREALQTDIQRQISSLESSLEAQEADLRADLANIINARESTVQELFQNLTRSQGNLESDLRVEMSQKLDVAQQEMQRLIEQNISRVETLLDSLGHNQTEIRARFESEIELLGHSMTQQSDWTKDCGGKFELDLRILNASLRNVTKMVRRHLNLWSCSDIQRGSGETPIVTEHSSTSYLIYPFGPEGQPKEVLCDFITEGGGWTIIQYRDSGPSDEFSRGWSAYEQGFGRAGGNFWLGLKTIHALTNPQSQELRIEFTLWDEPTVKVASYKAFAISNRNDLYRLVSVGDYSGTAGDSLSYNVGAPFSTKDWDNSRHNCPNIFLGAWWYTNCGYSNLNGLYNAKDDHSGTGITWQRLLGWASLKSVQMKIRPRR